SHRALSEHKTLSISWSHYRDTEEILATYRLLPETERQNLYRVVCLRHKELGTSTTLRTIYLILTTD
ncbi:hypothetical protein ACLBPL_27805, partial [Klebsiella pneumoniae]